MKIKQWYINWWIIKVKEKYKKKYREKYIKEYNRKLDEALKEREKDYDKQIKRFEKIIAEKDKYADDIIKNNKLEKEKEIAQTINFWKGIVVQKDELIDKLQKEKLNNRQGIIELKERTENLNISVDDIELSSKTFEHYMSKALQSLKVISKKARGYVDDNQKPIEKLENKLKEE